ncbi:ras GEF [Rickenella mellea]|uniref:Ras GEF n=1 Tax=Rickenella mellea TaxID=50990 RepID=A0A4Y7PM42_9AGAM|nr:ras GEF [Rickenella mellea]
MYRVIGRSSPRAAKIRQLLGDDAPERYIDNANANSKPWYLRSTYGQDEILINPDGGIRGGTLAALVERLTTHEYGDPIFIKTFLMTYKSFTNLNELFDLLVARFNIQAPDGLKPDELEEWKKSKQTIVRVRVINTFKTMIADSDVLEKDDNYILERMKGFAFNPDVAQLNARKPLLSLIERAQAGGDSVVKMAAVSSQFGPQSIQPKVSSSRKLKFLDVDALEMARQLTILESRVYNKIRAVECLQRARESNKVGEHHDHIADVIQVTNKIAYWVTNTVLSKEDSRKRAAIVKHFISIADRCRTLHNFSSMFAIISGLNSPPIRRLKRTWEQVNSKFMSQLGTCEMTLDSGKKFSNYRSTLAQVNPPCIPFIGIYLVDLNIIQSGSKDYLQLNVINFDKRQKAAEIIHEIKHWQSKQFDLLPLPAVLAFIEVSLESFNGTTNWDDYFWNTSLEREPRDRKDKKMARLLQKNGFL